MAKAYLALLMSVLAISLAGCELTIEEPQGAQDGASRIAASARVANLPAYDVAVSAIDFDPPLNRDTLLNSPRSIKLLAAIENRGTTSQQGLVVDASVTNQKGESLAQDQALIVNLSPGETRLVEFSGVAPPTALPRSPSFRIRVSVTSERSDANQENNVREVIVRVTAD